MNESAPYVDAVHAMYDGHSPSVPHIPAWLIADQRYRDRYVFAGLPPRRPLPRRWYQSGAVHRAPGLSELAGQIGIDAQALAKTVARFNEFAEAGRDEDFGRGDSAYDRYYGDPRRRPNPCLAPLHRPPFYAVKIVPGDLGTKGGLRTDERARVLRPDGTPIRGLYAAGQRERRRDGAQLRRRGRHHRARDDVRVYRGAGPGRRALTGGRAHERPAPRDARRVQPGPRIRPLVGTPVPAVTSTGPSPGTWFTESPRTWRTASAMPFMPWM